MSSLFSSLQGKLWERTSFFDVRLWAAIVIFTVLAAIMSVSIALCCWLIFRSRKRSFDIIKSNAFTTPKPLDSSSSRMMNRRLLSRNSWDVELCIGDGDPQEIQTTGYSHKRDSFSAGGVGQDFTLGEIQAATNSFATEYVIGSGDNGVVYRGVLIDRTRVAVKKLFVNRFKPSFVRFEWKLRREI